MVSSGSQARVRMMRSGQGVDLCAAAIDPSSTALLLQDVPPLLDQGRLAPQRPRRRRVPQEQARQCQEARRAAADAAGARAAGGRGAHQGFRQSAGRRLEGEGGGRRKGRRGVGAAQEMERRGRAAGLRRMGRAAAVASGRAWEVDRGGRGGTLSLLNGQIERTDGYRHMAD
ncbi:hypothetical protein C2845_PM03G24970 [Panicum miliaceum]|uniref:Uncharacterized protein n=1 Tax=Panicum miliaceum TaxID=4540 RepID=A0A3L6T9A6_PANMI|nr:hypothetical protein C2845_PM03G24970 [Panicum miliaceum]